MKKSIFCLMLTLAVFLAACDKNEKDTSDKKATSTSSAEITSTTSENKQETDVPSADSSVLEIWETLNTSFYRDDSSQFNNAVLNLKYLESDFVLFELKLMQGSEEEDDSYNTVISGIMTLNEDGTAVYETADDAENPQTIKLTLKETDDELSAEITSDGDFTISPDGHYVFDESYIEVSGATAVAILKHLPTAATSLNSNNGEYTLNFPDELISEWFYSAEAVFNDTGDTLAKFLIAKDLSAVFRVDDDIEPVMIYGTAQPMMDAYVMDIVEDEYIEEDDTEAGGYPSDEPRMLVQVSLPNGAYMQPGTSDTLEVLLPYDLPYTLIAQSDDETIVNVDENNNVTAVSIGEAIIDCTITCEDGVAMIGLAVTVTDDLESEDYTE